MFVRTEWLFGQDNMQKLAQAKVAVFGLGGVGGHVVEALARSGVGHLTLVDHDIITLSNLNRQIIATTKTIGMAKVDVCKERLLTINPEIKVTCYKSFYLPNNGIDLSGHDYIVDAIDTITAKIFLVTEAKRLAIPIISSMGTGNKINPLSFKVADIYQTTMCPLAKVMRRELKKRAIKRLKVVYSDEKPLPKHSLEKAPASTAFVPSVAGLIIASEVIKDLIDM